MAKKVIKENALVVQDAQMASLTEIQARIYMVRGVQVMLDRDLAVFYKVDTGQLNRQVKRNIGRFPEDFMFQLTKEEWKALKCQIGISKGTLSYTLNAYATIMWMPWRRISRGRRSITKRYRSRMS